MEPWEYRGEREEERTVLPMDVLEPCHPDRHRTAVVGWGSRSRAARELSAWVSNDANGTLRVSRHGSISDLTANGPRRVTYSILGWDGRNCVAMDQSTSCSSAGWTGFPRATFSFTGEIRYKAKFKMGIRRFWGFSIAKLRIGSQKVVKNMGDNRLF
jgi:hypothetical protein